MLSYEYPNAPPHTVAAALIGRGDLLEEMGRHDEAKADWARAEQLSPADSDIRSQVRRRSRTK